MANVTVRTLHHYDAIGLLAPSERSSAGYRLYARADLERLQQILVFREQHAQEAHERWGDSDAYAESMRRVRNYGKAERAELKRRGEETEERMAELLAEGADPESAKALAGQRSRRAP